MFLKPPTENQVIALAGIFQACRLVSDFASTGAASAPGFEVCIKALLQQNPGDVTSLYGGLNNLTIGLDTMQELLTVQGNSGGSHVLRYVIGVLHLRRQLYRHQPALDKIAAGITHAAHQAEVFSPTHDNVIANLAGIYEETISKFRYRIQVNGYAEHLQQQRIAQRIRCLLFSAIRSAALWHQLGGRRSQLIFHRHLVIKQLLELRHQGI